MKTLRIFRTEDDKMKTRWAGHAACTGKMKNTQIFVGKPERRSLGRHMHRWKDNIKTDLRKQAYRISTGCSWLWVGASRQLLTGNEPRGSIKDGESSAPGYQHLKKKSQNLAIRKTQPSNPTNG
jgi:hypothetical protein